MRSTDLKAPGDCSLPHYDVTRPSWDPGVFLSTLFSNALMVCEHQPSGHQCTFIICKLILTHCIERWKYEHICCK